MQNNIHPRLTNKPSTKNSSLTIAGSEGCLSGKNYDWHKKKKLKLTSVVGKTFYRDLMTVFNFLIDYNYR